MGRRNDGTTSQDHGMELERIVATSGAFLPHDRERRAKDALVDIDGRHDPILGLDTYVKATGSGVIGLADAVRFYEIDRTVRFMVGPWVQRTPETKRISNLLELLITMRAMDEIRGSISVDEIRDMHNQIATFPAGRAGAIAARRRADELKLAAKGRHGYVSLDFKIDDFTQRRLQLTLKVRTLETILMRMPHHVRGGVSHPLRTLHMRRFHALELPIVLDSPERQFADRKKAAPQKSFGDRALGASVLSPTAIQDAEAHRRLAMRKDDVGRLVSLTTGPAAQPILI